MCLGAREKNLRTLSAFFFFFFCKSRLMPLEATRCDNARSYALRRRYGVTKFLHVAIRNVAYYYAYNFRPRPFLSRLPLLRSFSFDCVICVQMVHESYETIKRTLLSINLNTDKKRDRLLSMKMYSFQIYFGLLTFVVKKSVIKKINSAASGIEM